MASLRDEIEMVPINPYLPESPATGRRIRAILSDDAHTFYLGFPNISPMKSPSLPVMGRFSEIRVPTLILVDDHHQIVALPICRSKKSAAPKRL